MKRLCLVALAIFGGVGLINVASYFGATSPELRAGDRWSAAIGLAVAVNALSWLVAEPSGHRHRGLRIVLAILLLVGTTWALYVGLEEVRELVG